MSGCPFCRKIQQGRDRHGPVTDEGSGIASFDPVNPVTEGHRLFVPIIHVTAAGHNPGAAGNALASAAAYAVRHGIREYNLIQSNGPAATQTVPHVHVHLVPRREGDGLALPWSGGAQREAWAKVAGDCAHPHCGEQSGLEAGPSKAPALGDWPDTDHGGAQ